MKEWSVEREWQATPYVILVTGDRYWLDGRTILKVMKRYPKNSIVIHGNASGADRLSGFFAKYLGMEVERFPYLGELGRAGGPVRNGHMVARTMHFARSRQPIVLAFHDDLYRSRGTWDCTCKALRAGLTVLHYHSGQEEPRSNILVGEVALEGLMKRKGVHAQ